MKRLKLLKGQSEAVGQHKGQKQEQTMVCKTRFRKLKTQTHGSTNGSVVLFCRSLFVFFCPFVFFCIELLYRNCIYLISYIVYFGRHSKFDDVIIAINIRAAMSNLDTPMECYSICKKHSSLYFQIVESRTGDTTICDKVCQ